MSDKPRMLEGYRILDFTQFVAGPVCTSVLAEMGAEVIKVEIAPGGDRTRGAGLKPLDEKQKHTTHSSYYLQHNHSKLSVALDMKKPQARELVMSMVPKVDVVVENFAPGVMKRMGFAYEDLKRVNPKIIMCSISMAGQTGPLSTRAGYDYIGQAYAGVTDGVGEADRAPSMTTMAIGDVSTGVASAMAVGFAIIHRDRTGEGQHLDASLLDTYFHMHDANVPMIALRGDKYKPTRAGSIPPTGAIAGIYPCGGGYVFICAVAHQWPQVVRALGMPELDSIAALEKERVPCAPVLTLNEAMRHPHLNERKTIRWIDDPILGKVAIPGLPVKFSAWPDRMKVRAARLGEDNEKILRDVLGMEDDQIGQLYADGVLVRDPMLGQS